MEASSDPEVEVNQPDVNQAHRPQGGLSNFSLCVCVLLNISAHFNTQGLYLFILQRW